MAVQSLSWVTIGVDCDSKAHGVAVYRGHSLVELLMMTTPQLIERFAHLENVLFSIEDTMANEFIYTRNKHKSKEAQSKIAMYVGRNQQASVELVRWLDHVGVRYRLIPPQTGNWANNEEQFKRLTGWSGRSNPDTRSASFMGFLALGDKR